MLDSLSDKTLGMGSAPVPDLSDVPNSVLDSPSPFTREPTNAEIAQMKRDIQGISSRGAVLPEHATVEFIPHSQG